jgi:serine/threonine-protein kinase HipA
MLTPAYDLMSTVIHTPHESDTALSLYEEDLDSKFYQHYGFYGKPNFIEFANRLGILEKRAERILLEFIHKNNNVVELIQQSFLSEATKQKYIGNYMDKIKRFTVVM